MAAIHVPVCTHLQDDSTVIKTYNHSSARWRRRRFRLGRLTEVTDFLLHNGTYGYIQERCQVPGTGNAS